MDKNYYSLGASDNNRFVKILQIVFGLFCITVAIFWFIFNLKSIKFNTTIWVTVLFLLLFGAYQIWAGSGKATRFIIVGDTSINLKKNSILPQINIMAADIERIEFFPLNVIFYFKAKRKVLLRFGTVYYETNGKIVDNLIVFAESNNIPFEILEDKLLDS